MECNSNMACRIPQNASAGTSEEDVTILAQSLFYYKASMIVNNYYGLSLVGVGLIGNTLSLLVMLQVGIFQQI